VVIGVSTGGPRALEGIVPTIPADLPVPVLAVQHMPATFTRLLAERLDRTSAISVCEAAEGQPIEPGRMYIAPGEHHLTVKRKAARTLVALNDGPPEHSCRPAADVLFRSAVELYGGNLLGVVLTGMGDDGSGGARAIRDAGGRMIVQDQATSVVWGMPGAIARAGLADRELPLGDIVPEIVRSVSVGRARARAT
jgi:two-component system chemotaxis response regulator CheB